MGRLTPLFVVLALVLRVTLVTGVAAENSPAGVCMSEGQRVVGSAPMKIDKQTPMLKKVRHVPIKYPDWPADIVGSGGWSGELLLDARGRVVQVWTTRDVKFNRPFPTFTQAIVEAMMQWVYEPVLVKNKPVPACLTITISINWS